MIRNIERGRPPVYDQIVETIGRPGSNVVYTWGETLFIGPAVGHVSQILLAHESRHSEQQEQAGGPEKWWERYLKDKAWRLEQEVDAYRAQYQFACAQALGRPQRRELLRSLARDLSGPTYGRIIKRENALVAIGGKHGNSDAE